MLQKVAIDAVHLTTPPQSHYTLAKQCMDAGVHVYLEKPFTVNAAECKSLINRARELDLRLTAGHNYQFTREMLKMRRLVEEGYLGGRPVHLESHFSYDLGDADYVKPFLGSGEHWVRKLPGKLLHNIASHGIARLAEFLEDDIAELTCCAWQSPRLAGIGCPEVLDELRVLLRDRAGTSASLCISTQVRPGLNRLSIYGPRNSICVESASGSIVRYGGQSYKSYLTFLIPPMKVGYEQFKNARRNAVEILRWRLHQDGGMKELIHRFHDSVENGSAPPIPYREIMLTASIMDRIFARLAVARLREKTYANAES
jgi:predicted dehydrogenase